MDRLRAAPCPVSHPEHDHATLAIGETGGILHRDLHVLLGSLPGLEVEPLGFEVVGGRGLQAVQDRKEIVDSGNRHLFRVDPERDGITRDRISEGGFPLFSVCYRDRPQVAEIVAS